MVIQVMAQPRFSSPLLGTGAVQVAVDAPRPSRRSRPAVRDTLAFCLATRLYTVREDGLALLDAAAAADAPPDLRALPSLDTLRQVWHHHYERLPGAPAHRKPPAAPCVRFKPKQEVPRAAEGIQSPYDPEARYRHKHTTDWVGYMVHVSETCKPTLPHLLTHVHTTTAAVHEAKCTADINHALVDKDVAPGEHWVDAAYIDAALLVRSQEDHGITLRGPAHPNLTWQSTVAGAYTVTDCTVDWEHEQVQCPQGKVSARWTERLDHTGSPCIAVRFAPHDCRACDARPLCTQATQAARTLKLQPQTHFEALHAARAWYASAEGEEGSQRRAGSEGTLSQGVRAFGLRRTRYWGAAKTHLQHVASAATINIDHIVA